MRAYIGCRVVDGPIAVHFYGRLHLCPSRTSLPLYTRRKHIATLCKLYFQTNRNMLLSVSTIFPHWPIALPHSIRGIAEIVLNLVK